MKLKVGDTEVARIGLGTNRLRNTPANVALVKEAIAAGVGMIDTAHTYTGGESEQTIGAALSREPEHCFIATKGGGGGGSGRGRPEILHAEIEESQRGVYRAPLSIDSIPLYYLHRVDPETPIEESLAAIDEYRERGQIRHIGISEVSIAEIERARRVVPITAVQNHYSLSERKHEEVVDYCARESIVFVPFFPLRADRRGPLEEIAARHGATAVQITLAWLLRRSPAMLPIPGTLSLEHLKENLAALQIELTNAEFEALR